tara:strand:+ start:555 stop:1847 length:1293 start_codon:yes stop_codon:yes gene_type:complete
MSRGGGTSSGAFYERALRVIPGGVNSPVRAFRAVGGVPVMFERGEGAYLTDVDGRRFVDLVMSWGAMILGHAHPAVVSEVEEAVSGGTSFGAPCPDEVKLAEHICKMVPSVERVRMVSSGTEAVMSAIRLARAYTHRSKILKFKGCYHGHADSMLVRAGSGVATLSLPDSPGVPSGAAEDTLVAQFNDLDSVAALFDEHQGNIAAVIVEPVAGNMGLIPPTQGFLEGLQSLTSEWRALLIFDEVMTGFRVGPSGAQGLFGITPDLTTFGKVIGGGFPVGAFGGRAEIMDQMAPAGPVYQAGTLSGNPIAMRAGLTTLRHLTNPAVYEALESKSCAFADALTNEAESLGIALQTSVVGGMFGFYFAEHTVNSWEEADTCDRERFAAFFHGMLEAGVYLPPSPFEACFISTVHGDSEVECFRAAANSAMKTL